MKLIKLLFIFFISLNILYASISLSPEEKDWIKNNPIIKVGIDKNWPPFEFVDKSNNHKGISSEYLEQVSLKTGLNFQIYPDKWSNVMDSIKNKKIDILACAANTKERRDFLSFTDSYIDIDIAVVVRNDHQIDSFDQIEDYKIALPKDNFIHESLKKRFPNATFVFTKSNEEALEYVSYKKADIYVGNLPVISYFIEKNFLTNLTIAFKAPMKKVNLSMGVVKEKEILLSILNKVLDSIKEEEKSKIAKRWVNLKTVSKVNNSFTLEEKKWIYENENIKMAGDINWPPYSFLNEEGEYVGIVPDLVKEVFEDSNINIEFVRTENWNKTLSLFQDKKLDIIDAISYSSSRSKYANFSTTFLGSEIVFISNKNKEAYIDSLSSIKNKKIATISGYSIIEKINKDYPNIDLTLYDRPLLGLKALITDEIDYLLLDIPSFDYYNKKHGFSNLKIAGPSGYSYKYGFAIQKDNPLLLSISNKLLDSVPQSKKDDIYRQWIKFDYSPKIDYSLVWKVLVIALLIIFGTIYWNRKLQVEINRRKQIQKALKENKDFVNAVLDSQSNIVITKKGSQLTQVNKAFYKFFGFKSLDEFKKENSCISNLFDITDDKYLKPRENNKDWIDLVIDNPDVVYKVLIKKDNKPYIFKITAAEVSKNSNLKTAVFTDITKLEDLNEILLKAKNDAENIAKQKSEFLANMSHEIRTPMNSVIGFTELLDREISNPIQKDYLNSIKKGGNSLLRIINDILDLSKIEAGKLEIKNESINPKNLFLEIEAIFHSKIVSKNINFIIDIDKNIPSYVILDGVRVRQILFNLIGNAIKFTEKGHIKLKVETSYKDNIKSKIDLIFSIEDTGIGIDEEYLSIIFNSFEQQKNQSEVKYGGTGLGLAICKKLVSMMNGEIEVASKKNRGSTFKVSLFDVSVSSLKVEESEDKIDVSNIVFEKSTILVVDDIKENIKLIQAVLKDYNLNLITAENGQDAISKLKNVKIDLILMDLRMPVMDGYEAATIIKSDSNLKQIPLIALTASVMGKDLEKVSQYGFDGYLRKPVVIDDLIKELIKFLAHSNNDTQKDVLSIENNTVDKKLINDVIDSLDGKYKDIWNDIKDKGDFSLIEEFATNLNNIALDKSISLLENYSKDLLNHIESFDIEKVDYLMNTYEEMIDKLRLLKDDSGS